MHKNHFEVGQGSLRDLYFSLRDLCLQFLDYEANSSTLWVERNTQKCDNRICADDPLWMILVWKSQAMPSNNNNDYGKITIQSISVEKILVDKTGWCLSF